VDIIVTLSNNDESSEEEEEEVEVSPLLKENFLLTVSTAFANLVFC